MMSAIRVYRDDEVEFWRLNRFCRELNELYPEGQFRVSTVYFDFGQNWQWTTILAKSRALNMEYQILSPDEHSVIISSTTGRNDWNDLLEKIVRKARD